MKYLVSLNKSECELVCGGYYACNLDNIYSNCLCTCKRKTGHQDGSISSDTSTAGIVTMAIGGGMILIGLLFVVASKIKKTGYTEL